MKRLLLAATLLLPGLARPDVLTFPQVSAGKGYAGPIAVSVKNQDGTTRDVSALTGSLTVYRISPTAGTGGTVLFTKSLTGASGGLMSCTVTASDTGLPGSYYAEVSITDTGVVDVWHGVFVIEGR
jgi:hypothetical protein